MNDGALREYYEHVVERLQELIGRKRLTTLGLDDGPPSKLLPDSHEEVISEAENCIVDLVKQDRNSLKRVNGFLDFVEKIYKTSPEDI